MALKLVHNALMRGFFKCFFPKVLLLCWLHCPNSWNNVLIKGRMRDWRNCSSLVTPCWFLMIPSTFSRDPLANPLIKSSDYLEGRSTKMISPSELFAKFPLLPFKITPASPGHQLSWPPSCSLRCLWGQEWSSSAIPIANPLQMEARGELSKADGKHPLPPTGSS